MVRITTPIPQYLIDWGRSFWSQSLIDRLWQLFLIFAGGLLVAMALSSSVGLIAAFAGVVFSFLIADDIKKTVSDIWHRNFWIWRI